MKAQNLYTPESEGIKALHDKLSSFNRIAWYPSAGMDFRPLVYLDPRGYPSDHPVRDREPDPPDIFLFSDYMGPVVPGGGELVAGAILHRDDRTTVHLDALEELPRLSLALHPEIVDFPEGSEWTNRAFFMRVRVESNEYGRIEYPVIYVCASNEALASEFLIPNKIKVSHIITVRYGEGFGGSKVSGEWLLDVLKKLHCEVFITSGAGGRGDTKTVNAVYPNIPVNRRPVLIPFRSVPGTRWSGIEGDTITWYRVSRRLEPPVYDETFNGRY